MWWSGSQFQHWDGGHRGRDSLEEGFHQHRYGSLYSLCWEVGGSQGHRLVHHPAGCRKKEGADQGASLDKNKEPESFLSYSVHRLTN